MRPGEHQFNNVGKQCVFDAPGNKSFQFPFQAGCVAQFVHRAVDSSIDPRDSESRKSCADINAA
jgi:hypothetical protein